MIVCRAHVVYHRSLDFGAVIQFFHVHFCALVGPRAACILLLDLKHSAANIILFMQVWRLCLRSSGGSCSRNMCTSDGSSDEADATSLGE